MMLKTLKDIPNEHDVTLFKVRLQQEVFEWIKKFEKIEKQEEPSYDFNEFEDRDTEGVSESYSYGKAEFRAVKKWIKHFFNIVEEDLK